MRPTYFHIGSTIYWVIQTRNPDTMVLKDADSTPTVVVRKNGSSVGDSVTVTKRSATTGIYDCSYNPAGEVEGDTYTLEESVTITGTSTGSATYTSSFVVTACAVERGTDSAATPTNVTDARDVITALLPTALAADGSIKASLSAVLGTAVTEGAAGRLAAAFIKWLNVATPTGTINSLPDATAGSAGGVAIVGSEMGLTSAVLTALFEDTDIDALVDAIIERVESDLDGSDLSTQAIAVACRNAILDRILAGNHDSAGSVGKVLQFLDAPISDIPTNTEFNARTLASADYATASALSTVGSNITTIMNRVTESVYTMWTDLIAMITGSGVNPKFTVSALSNAPAGGGGGGGDATLAKQEEILEAIDELSVTQLAAITVESGVIANFPDTLTIGDSYTSNTGQIKIAITDSDGDPITSLGSLEFDEADIEFSMFRPNDSTILYASECVFVDGGAETYVLITIPSSVTLQGKAEYTYEGRLKFFWEGPSSGNSDDEQKTYKTTPFKFVNNP